MIEQYFCDCDLCGGKFEFGGGKYYGKKIQAWDAMLCDTCRKGNWDGIVPNVWPHFIKKLEDKGIEISLNEKGWLNIPN